MLNLGDPKTSALFKINLAAGTLSRDLVDNFQNIRREEYQAAGEDVSAAVNQVTYAIKRLIDLTNDKLDTEEQS